MFEQLSDPWWAYLLVGIAAGILSGALGVGSGILLVPVLVTLFTLPQRSAQGTALAVMVPMALLGAIRYSRIQGVEINMTAVALLAAGALAGVLVGTEIAGRLPGHWLRKAFAVFMVIVAVRLFFLPPRRGDSPAGPASGPHADVRELKGEEQ